MLLLEKLLKILLKESKPCSQSCKNVLGRWTPQNTLSQPQKNVIMNNIISNANGLEVDNLKVL